MARGELAQAPIWDSIESFDGRPWRGRVDLAAAGYPCQPESVAGKRRGADDERWLWHEVWRVVREMGAGHLFVENVTGHLSGTFPKVLGDMASSGWSAEWDCFPAAAVGAPHIRDRVFCLAANPDGHRLQGERSRGQLDSREWQERGGYADRRGGAAVDDSQRSGLEEWHRLSGNPHAQLAAPQRGGHYWDRVPAPEPFFCRMDDGTAHRLDRDWADRLHALGNGVVPQAAAAAFAVLWERLHGVTA